MDLQRSPSRVKALTSAIVALGLLFSTFAGAQEPGQDEVTLKNGGTVRGTVVSSEPGTSVKIIEVGQTQVRVIPWSQVSDVEKGKYAPRAPAQPGPAGPGYGAPPPPMPVPMQPQPVPVPQAAMGDPGVVRLHIDSPLPATMIERQSALVGAYGGYGLVLTQQRTVCSAPCDQVVDGTGGRIFLLTDEQYPAPKPFAFAGMTGDVTLHVAPGSHGKRIGGTLAIIFGTAAAVTGAILLPIGVNTTTTDLNTNVEVSTPQKGLTDAGIGLLAGGLAALGAGIALAVTGATTVNIEQRGAAPSAPAAQATPRYWMGEF